MTDASGVITVQAELPSLDLEITDSLNWKKFKREGTWDEEEGGDDGSSLFFRPEPVLSVEKTEGYQTVKTFHVRALCRPNPILIPAGLTFSVHWWDAVSSFSVDELVITRSTADLGFLAFWGQHDTEQGSKGASLSFKLDFFPEAVLDPMLLTFWIHYNVDVRW